MKDEIKYMLNQIVSTVSNESVIPRELARKNRSRLDHVVELQQDLLQRKHINQNQLDQKLDRRNKEMEFSIKIEESDEEETELDSLLGKYDNNFIVNLHADSSSDIVNLHADSSSDIDNLHADSSSDIANLHADSSSDIGSCNSKILNDSTSGDDETNNTEDVPLLVVNKPESRGLIVSNYLTSNRRTSQSNAFNVIQSYTPPSSRKNSLFALQPTWASSRVSFTSVLSISSNRLCLSPSLTSKCDSYEEIKGKVANRDICERLQKENILTKKDKRCVAILLLALTIEADLPAEFFSVIEKSPQLMKIIKNLISTNKDGAQLLYKMLR